MASLEASEAAMISASQLESAIEACLLDPQEMAALESMKTQPDVEWRTAQSESVIPYGVVQRHGTGVRDVCYERDRPTLVPPPRAI